jgi:integrase
MRWRGSDQDSWLHGRLSGLIRRAAIITAVRKLVGEARRNNLIGSEEAASLTDVPNIRQKGARLESWLTCEHAKELLAVPDRTLKGKFDYVILALLVGCALRRNELAELDVETIHNEREGGCWPTSRARAGASAPLLSPSGSSRASTPG